MDPDLRYTTATQDAESLIFIGSDDSIQFKFLKIAK